MYRRKIIQSREIYDILYEILKYIFWNLLINICFRCLSYAYTTCLKYQSKLIPSDGKNVEKNENFDNNNAVKRKKIESVEINNILVLYL